MNELSPHTKSLLDYYANVYSKDLDLGMLRGFLEVWKEQEDELKSANEYDLVTVEFIETVINCYKSQKLRPHDYLLKGIELGHINSIIRAAGLIEDNISNMSYETEIKVLEGLSTIIYSNDRNLASAVADRIHLSHECGNNLELSDSAIAEIREIKRRRSKQKPTGLRLKNATIPLEAFDVTEWHSIAYMIKTGLSKFKDSKRKSGFVDNYRFNNYDITFYCYLKHAKFSITLGGIEIYRKKVKCNSSAMQLSNIASAIEEMLKKHEETKNIPFLNPGLFLKDLQPRQNYFQEGVKTFRSEFIDK